MRRPEALLALAIAACAPAAATPPAPAAPSEAPSPPLAAAPPSATATGSATTAAPPASAAPTASVAGATTAPIPTLAPPAKKPPAPASSAAPPRPATPAADGSLDALLAGGGAALKAVLAKPEVHRFQVLYARVTPGAPAALERRSFRADAEYFFPASSMKMPIALALYDRFGALRPAQPGLVRDATMRIHPVSGAGEPYVTTLARETWRALIVSDNASANRLLSIVGHRELHETLWGLGLPSVRVHTGFSTGGDIDPAEVSPRVELAGPAGPAELGARRSDLVLPPTSAPGLDIGKARIENGRRVEGPLSFAAKNAIRMRDLQDTLVRIMRPELLGSSSKDTASRDDLEYLRQALGTLPSESGLAGFARNVVADYNYVPFLRGIERVRPRGKFRVYTKVGQAYGFVVSNAYVVDVETERAFFLVAAVYANPDDTLNDDVYAYDTVALPALADVAEVITRDAFGK